VRFGETALADEPPVVPGDNGTAIELFRLGAAEWGAFVRRLIGPRGDSKSR
jgi:hypothetical protein